jgi:hypothetical protein
VVLAGGSAGKLDLERPGRGPEPGPLRNELGHRRRGDLVGLDTNAGHVGLTVADASNMIVPPALNTMAAVGVSTFAPGRPHLVSGLAADLSTALETTTPFERGSDLVLRAPVLLHDGMFCLGARPARSDHRSLDKNLPVTLSVELSRPGWAEIGAGANHPMVFLVDAQAEQAAVHPGHQAADVVGRPDVTQAWYSSPLANGFPGQQPALPAAGPQTLGAGPGPADGTQMPVAAIIWGSALLAATGRRVLDADTLVCFARQAILRETQDRSPVSAVLAMRLASALEIVVLLDVVLNGGIWIDVNPGTEEATATLLIDGFPGDPGGTMRFLHA